MTQLPAVSYYVCLYENVETPVSTGSLQTKFKLY